MDWHEVIRRADGTEELRPLKRIVPRRRPPAPETTGLNVEQQRGLRNLVLLKLMREANDA
jgi:hypothetical protein